MIWTAYVLLEIAINLVENYIPISMWNQLILSRKMFKLKWKIGLIFYVIVFKIEDS